MKNNNLIPPRNHFLFDEGLYILYLLFSLVSKITRHKYETIEERKVSLKKAIDKNRRIYWRC